MHPDAAAWFARRTSAWTDWTIPALQEAKGSTRVSVVLPALDEEPTVGEIVAGIVKLRDATGLVDEIFVIDSGSEDDTAAVAAAAGATVRHRDDILPEYGSQPGKGEVLWKALAVTTGDILVYVDADLTDFRQTFVTGLLGPLLTDPSVRLVKAFYDRPLLDSSPAGGGRVTELAARPLLNAYFPELAGVVQPLAGEYAARRSLLSSLPFAAGYGVETGLLIDTVREYGLDAVAQVDLGARTHGHQDTAALGRMSATILATVLARATPDHPLWSTLTQFRRDAEGRIEPVTQPTRWPERPPMQTVLRPHPPSPSTDRPSA
ncbi:MAG TPA: glucosyl-3-phosphoglycerate synthase [Micromonosporaceae bacterium]|jgi:glucosyl-3-phosphoglycerate synthase